MKIAIVVDDYSGGAGNVAQLLACELAKKHDIILLLVDKVSEQRYDMPQNVKQYFYSKRKNNSGLLNSFCISKWLREILVRKERVESVISFLNTVSVMTCFALLFSKIHLTVSERSDPRHEKLGKKWELLRRIAYLRAQNVSVQFEDFKTFDKGRFAKKCVLTPNIVNMPSIRKHNWDYTGNFRFVSMGRFNDVKRFPLMIECFEKCNKTYPDSELHLYGKGEKKDELLNYVKEHNLCEKVIIHEHCQNVYDTLVEYDCYLMTSIREGFPNALTEAMAVGLPSVCFVCNNGIREMCQNGEAGLLVENGDSVQFANRMKEIISSAQLREKLGKNATKVVDIYSKDVVMEAWRRCL